MTSSEYDDLCVSSIMADLAVVGNNLSVVRQQVVRTTFNLTLEINFWSNLLQKLPWCNDKEISDDVLEKVLTDIFNREMVNHTDQNNFKLKVARNSPLIRLWTMLKFDLLVSFEHGSLPVCYESRTSEERKQLCKTITLELRNMFPHLCIENVDLIIKCLIIRFELRRSDGSSIPDSLKNEVIKVLEEAMTE